MKRVLLIAALIIFVIALLILVVHIFFVKLLEADMRGNSTIDSGDEDFLIQEQTYNEEIYIWFGIRKTGLTYKH